MISPRLVMKFERPTDRTCRYCKYDTAAEAIAEFAARATSALLARRLFRLDPCAPCVERMRADVQARLYRARGAS